MPRVIVLGILLVLAACRSRPPAEVTPVIVEADRFPHDQHGSVACIDCHDAAAVAAGLVQIPGSRDHAPCDRGECHRPAFEAEPGPLCRVCHVSVDVTGAAPPLMVAYPRTAGWRVMPPRFSHQLHLDLRRMEDAVGFHVSCTDCHIQGDVDVPSIGGHGECARCHAEEVGLDKAPSMAQCTGCHEPNAREERHRRRTITGDLHFDHRNHLDDATGATIRCVSCHGGVDAAKGRDDVPAPAIAACVACHDDAARVPSTMRMRTCQTCHATISETFGRLAPRSHLPATERPVDHTLAFRRDHGEEAKRDASKCAACHTQMSGNDRDACDECHSVMRPWDHNVVFRDTDHGTSASTDPERCATCHVVDYCVACHRKPPRSHMLDWELAHGEVAKMDVRGCMVCHDPDGAAGGTGCGGAGCHPGIP